MAADTVQHAVTAVEQAAAHHDVSTGVTLLFTGILVAMIATLALEEKLHAKKSLIVGVFAVISLLLGAALHIIPFGKILLPGGHSIDSASLLSPFVSAP